MIVLQNLTKVSKKVLESGKLINIFSPDQTKFYLSWFEGHINFMKTWLSGIRLIDVSGFNKPTPENANFGTFSVLAFSLLSLNRGQ